MKLAALAFALPLVLLTAVNSFAEMTVPTVESKSAYTTAEPLTVAYEGGRRYPTGPNEEMTPGALCTHPDSYRYDERIAYCERDVDTDLKKDIIEAYDREFGYHIGAMPRSQFKIDHYIPLCMGGANDRSNLWPQHQSVYQITDQLEQQLCEKMAQGKMLQAQAIELIKRAKNHLDEAPTILANTRAM